MKPQNTEPASNASSETTSHALVPSATPSPPRSTEPSIGDVITTLSSFMEMVDGRLSRLEGAAFYLQQLLERSPIPSTPSLPASPQDGGDSRSDEVVPAVAASAVSLEFVGMETKWYTERVFPEFELRAMKGGAVYQQADGWKITLRLKDGNGNFSDARLGDTHARTVIMHQGRAVVSGIRFSAVSSKNGKHFNIHAQVTAPAPEAVSVAPQLSQNLVIVSCRLYHNPKRQLDELTPDDQLSKMPGIGRLYAERFASFGVSTIRQLASVSEERRDRLALLSHLRRDKGTMTEPKLCEYVATATDIVKRFRDPSYCPADIVPERAAKRVCVSEIAPPAHETHAEGAVLVDQYLDFKHTETTGAFAMPAIPNLLGGTPVSLPASAPSLPEAFAFTPETLPVMGGAVAGLGHHASRE